MPVDDEKPATTGELHAVRSELKAETQAVKSELHAVRTELKTDIQSVRSELKTEIQAVRSELKTEIQSVKSELKADIHRLAVQVVNNHAEFKSMAATMATKDDMGRVLKSIDSFAARLEIYGRETVFIPKTLDAHGEIIRGHETRIKALEDVSPR